MTALGLGSGLAVALAAVGAALAVALVVGGADHRLERLVGSPSRRIAPSSLASGAWLSRAGRSRWFTGHQRDDHVDPAMVADVLAACLAAGAPPDRAAEAAAHALGAGAGPLLEVVARSRLGDDPIQAWRSVGGPLAAAAGVVARSIHQGSPAAPALHRLAAAQRTERSRTVRERARRAAVMALAPLAACHLPAFLLLGVVPVVIGLLTELAPALP